MATVSYRNIAKNFGAVKVIEDLSLDIADEEFTVLLGPSGCGKTTLLRMTAGLETVTGGDLLIDGKRINEVHPRDRDIAMVFQNYALYPTMRVFENIGFSLEVKKLPKEEVTRRVNEAAELLNLTELLRRYPRELSGGQRQRVAMGRAMVRDAKVFLFDEPLSNLDAKLRAHMRFEIRQLHNRLKTTTLYVTHDQIEAMTMADKIVLMRGGDIEQVGTPDDLYDQPASRYVADFIGSPGINFVTGELHGEPGRLKFRAPGVELSLPATCAGQPGQSVTGGLRPTDITVSDAGSIVGRIVLAEKTGAEQNLHLDVGGHDFVATAPRGVAARAGDEVRLGIPPANVHIFDATTEQRL